MALAITKKIFIRCVNSTKFTEITRKITIPISFTYFLFSFVRHANSKIIFKYPLNYSIKRTFSNISETQEPTSTTESSINQENNIISQLSKLGFQGKITDMVLAFENFSKKSPLEVSTIHYNIVIHYSCITALKMNDEGFLEIPFQFYRQLKRSKLKLNDKTFGTFLTTLKSLQRYEDFISVISSKKKVLPLTIQDHNSLLEVLGKLKQYQHMEALAAEMRSKGIMTHTSYVVLAKIYASMNKADKILDLLEESRFMEDSPKRKLQTCLINFYLDKRNLSEALKIFETMKKMNDLDRIVYNAFINWYILEKDIKSAMDWYEKLKTSKLGVGADTLSILLSGFSRLNNFQLLDEIMKETEGIEGDRIMYDSIIDCLGAAGRIKEMEAYLESTKSKHIPDAATYSILLKAYKKKGNLEKIRRIKEEMEERNFVF